MDGDHILAICGLRLLKQGKLPHNKIAATVYSNGGLVQAFREAGGDVVITAAGDRYVLKPCSKKGLFWAESSLGTSSSSATALPVTVF